ncbi:MAG TPA: hypothetical protein VJR04_06905 [Terriglobales bacterium]|nr:hypothetical protein [Terriglobales bacterium]
MLTVSAEAVSTSSRIDWTAVATIAAPVVTLFLGGWVNRWFENRPILISYFSHVSSFRTTPPDGSAPVVVNTHSVVLRNTGRRAATNVRLRHIVLPDFNIWPGLLHHVDTLLDGSKEIVIPTLVPSEQITISYLYFPPLTVAQVNGGIKSDQGFAHQIPVLLQRQYPKWFNILAIALFLFGLSFALYLAYEGVLHLIRT